MTAAKKASIPASVQAMIFRTRLTSIGAFHSKLNRYKPFLQRGGGPTSSVTGGISTLAVSLNPFSATEKGGGDQRLLLQVAFRHYNVYADPDPLPPRVRPPHATATTLLLTRRQGEGVELTASFHRLPTGEILHYSVISFVFATFWG